MPTFFAFHLTNVCSAQTLTTDTDLSFGEIAILTNTSISTTTLTRNGSVSNTGSILLIQQGTPGEYTISGLTPFTTVSLSIALPVESIGAGVQQLTFTNADFPATVVANSLGEASFKLGGTIATSGLGGSYISTETYLFFLEIEITL